MYLLSTAPTFASVPHTAQNGYNLQISQ